MNYHIDLTGKWQLAEIKLPNDKINRLNLTDFNELLGNKDFIEKLRNRKNWLTGEVPGDVWQDLFRNKRIPHPFLGLNIPALQWIENRIWCYRKTFVVPRRLVGRIDLVFEGLDTFATLVLNGKSICQTDNMFHAWRFDVTDTIERGKPNELFVVFHPWQLHTKDNDISKQWAAFCKERVWVRKAQMEFGWDWGPRIVLSGIWRPVRLEVIRSIRISSWHVKTLIADPQHAFLEIKVKLDRIARGPVHLEVTLCNSGQKCSASVVTSQKIAKIKMGMPHPKLWWPRNLGKPNLYDLTINAYIDGKRVDGINSRIGIRTIKLVQRPQRGGCRSFTFKINRKKVFLSGANWIPADSFLASVTSSRYRALLTAAANVNMNAIRVWGGGIYEDEAFYNLCDELGLMVWQDFMFACGAYPGQDSAFLANIEREVQHVIRRLRNHPSIILWNGNNEIQWGDNLIHWDKPDHRMPDHLIYHNVLPECVRWLDNTRPYWPSSPFGGNDHNDWRQGNHHAWQVWGGAKIPRKFNENPGHPEDADLTYLRHYRHYADVVPRFVSEFGIHSLPYKKTLEAYLTKSEMKLDSKAMIFRNKAGDNFDFILPFIETIAGQIKNYDDFEIKSQLAQTLGLQFALDHYRRNLWQCSGALIWQLNDCWPGFSWSLLDYHLLPKPAYFAVKRSLASRSLSLCKNDERYQLWAVNTSGKPWHAQANISIHLFIGTLLGQGKIPLHVENDHSKLLVADVVQKCGLSHFDARRSYIRAEMVGGVKTYPAWYLDDPKRIDLPPAKIKVTLNVQKAKTGYDHKLTISNGDTFAYFVGIIPPGPDAIFDDNFNHIEPGNQLKINFKSTREYSLKQLRIRGYNCFINK